MNRLGFPKKGKHRTEVFFSTSFHFSFPAYGTFESSCQRVCSSCRVQLVGWLLGWLAGWLGWLVGCLVPWFLGLLVGSLVRSFGCLVCSLVGWLFVGCWLAPVPPWHLKAAGLKDGARPRARWILPAASPSCAAYLERIPENGEPAQMRWFMKANTCFLFPQPALLLLPVVNPFVYCSLAGPQR